MGLLLALVLLEVQWDVLAVVVPAVVVLAVVALGVESGEEQHGKAAEAIFCYCDSSER